MSAEDILPAINELSRSVSLVHNINPPSTKFLSARERAEHSMEQALHEVQAALLAMRRVNSIARDSATQHIASAFTQPYNVILGGGSTELPGWVNLDIRSAVVPFDLRQPLPFGAGQVRRVYAAFVLEHLFYPDEAVALMREVHRVLIPGGVARILVPNAEHFIQECFDPSDNHIQLLKSKWTGAPQFFTPLASTLFYLGAAGGVLPGPRSHKFAYDFELLKKLCLGAGFAFVHRSHQMGALDRGLNLDEQSIALEGLKAAELVLFVDVEK